VIGPYNYTTTTGISINQLGSVGIANHSPSGIFDVSAARTSPAYIRTPLYSRIPVVDISSTTSQTVTLEGSGTYYSIRNSSFNAITLISGITNESGGAFWSFKNNTPSLLSITIGNIGANTTTFGTPLPLPAGNSVTIAVSADLDGCHILL
jgi:hypothetical protein